MSTKPRPPFIVHETQVEETTFSYPGSTEVLCPARAIGKAAGLVRTGIHIERLLPGTRTSFPHAEEDEEEWAYVLSGAPSVWIDGVVHALVPGDLVALPAGTGVCHVFLNDSATEARILVGGEKSRPTNRIFYPLNPERRAQVGERWWPLEATWRAAGDHDGKPRGRLLSLSIALSLALAPSLLGCTAPTPMPPPPAPPPVWTTLEVIAGETSRGVADGVGDAARFNGPAGLGVDGARALISDTFSASVRTVELDGATVATALRAPAVTEPRGITGHDGTIWFGDATCVRRLDAGATEPMVLAGDCFVGGYVDGPAASARFEFLLHDLELDATRGALYATDRLNDAVRAIDLISGEVRTLAGGAGTGRDDGVGSEARFDGPGGLALDEAAGVLYVADTFNDTLRAIDLATASVSTLAGAAGVGGAVDGPVASARLSAPQGLALVERTLVFGGFDGAARAVELDEGRVRTLVSGLAGTFASLAALPGERAVLWMDLGDSLLRIDLDAAADFAVTHVAGPRAPFGFVDGTGEDARFVRPTAVAVDEEAGVAYVSDLENHAIRVVDVEARTVGTLVGGPTREGDRDGTLDEARLSSPAGLALDRAAGVLYVADLGNQKIRAVDLHLGEVRTLAGSGSRGGQDGDDAEASFADPWELALGRGVLFVADSGGATVRQVSLDDGSVSTLAGSYGEDGHTDGVGAAARLRVPAGLASDGERLFVADYGAHTLRSIDLATGEVSTLLGVDGFEGAAAGPSEFATLASPTGLALSSDGARLFVAEETGHVLREVLLADGSSRFVAGQPGMAGGMATGVPFSLAEATLLEPQDVGVLGDRLVVLSDSAVWLVAP